MLHFAVPGDLGIRTGGFGYDRRMVAGLRARGWQVEVHDLGCGFPHPSARERVQADATLQRIEDGALAVVDGLALGAMPSTSARLASRLRLVALVHHPLALETGLGTRRAARLRCSETVALASARRIIVTSRATAGLLNAFGVRPVDVSVVSPGTDHAPLAIGSRSITTRILCVATVTPRKGHAILLEALSRLTDLPWHLTCIGSLNRDCETALAVREQSVALGLEGRVEFPGVLAATALERAYHEADLVVLASFMEGYGMALAEALARGIPVVSTRAGAIPDLVPARAGLLVDPGNPVELARALVRVLCDPNYRRALARGARAVGRQLPTWRESVARFEAELLALGAGQ